MKAHEKIYDILYSNPDYWYSVAEMRNASGLSESTVRRAFHHLEGAELVSSRFLAGRAQYSMAFIPKVTPPKRGWFRRRKDR